MNNKDIEIKKFDYLDRLRGFAIIGVVGTHIHYLNFNIWNNSCLDAFFSAGGMGVVLFFIVSAFTLCLSCEQRELNKKNNRKNFYIRRFFRIYPMFLFMCILVYLLFSILSNSLITINFDTSIYNLLSHLFFTFGIFPKYISSLFLGEWSLFCEVFFYLLFPFLYLLVRRKKIKFTLYLLILSGIISYACNLFSYLNTWFNLYGTPLTHMFSFILGLFIYKLTKQSINIKNFGPLKTLNILLYILLIYLFSLYGYLHIYILFSLNLGLTVFLFATKRYDIKHYFFSHFLQQTGKISYSLYLRNFRVFQLIGNYIIKNDFGVGEKIEMLFIIIILFILFGLSFITYKYIEQKWIIFGKQHFIR